MPESKTITKECLYCKNTFELFVSEKKRFCSKLCYRMSQIGCKEKKSCPVCNKEFLSHICKQQECCSKECRHKLHSKKMCQKKEKECLFCKEMFAISPSKEEQNFCSLECYFLSTKEKRPKCRVCGNITAHSKSIYCSRICMAKAYEEDLRKESNPNWKGGKNKRFSSGISLSLRKRVLAKDNHKCKICGVKDWDKIPSILHIHHIVEVKNGGTNDMENLETLCFVCHLEVKHGFRLNEYLQQIASESGCGIRQTNS